MRLVSSQVAVVLHGVHESYLAERDRTEHVLCFGDVPKDLTEAADRNGGLETRRAYGSAPSCNHNE